MPSRRRAGGGSTSGLTRASRSTSRRSSARFAALTELADTNAAEEPVWKEPVRGEYTDPAVVALSGRERLEGWRRRTWPPPPLSHLTGALPTRFGGGTPEAEMPASGWLAASPGVISGGTLAILAHIAFGCSIET